LLSVDYIKNTTPVSTLEKSNTMSKDDFLKLLITQLKNQDPLEPVKNEDMAAQLAQFSSLEELQNIRQATEDSSTAMQNFSSSVNSILSTSLIGKKAKSAASIVSLTEGQTTQIPIDLFANAQNVYIRILDSQGNIVRTIQKNNLTKGSNFIDWDGLGDYGTRNPSGVYSYTVVAGDASGNPVAVNPYIEGVIDGVVYDQNNIYFMIDGNRVPYSNITEITDASGD
jgi:flagellar basal-body rod modification protein FlgD